jgi:hypothetical protein
MACLGKKTFTPESEPTLQNDSETDVPEKTNAMIGFNYS